MFTILYRIVSYDFNTIHPSTNNERIIGIFQTLQEAKETALRMAQSIFDKAYKAALENISGTDSNLLPSMDEGEIGVSVYYLLNPEEAPRYHADSIAHNFTIKEIENVVEKH